MHDWRCRVNGRSIDDIEHLNTVGLARNFNVVGSSRLITDNTPAGP